MHGVVAVDVAVVAAAGSVAADFVAVAVLEVAAAAEQTMAHLVDWHEAAEMRRLDSGLSKKIRLKEETDGHGHVLVHGPDDEGSGGRTGGRKDVHGHDGMLSPHDDHYERNPGWLQSSLMEATPLSPAARSPQCWSPGDCRRPRQGSPCLCRSSLARGRCPSRTPC